MKFSDYPKPLIEWLRSIYLKPKSAAISVVIAQPEPAMPVAELIKPVLSTQEESKMSAPISDVTIVNQPAPDAELILAKLKALIVADEHYVVEEIEKLIDVAKTLAAKV
jgi:hypothetical protein